MTDASLPLRLRPPGPRFRWGLRAVALAGFGLSAWLAWAGASGLPGCDATSASGCGAVLSTVWGRWLGLPVSLGGAAVHLSIFLVTLAMGARPSATRWTLLLALGVAALASALWFTGLQALEVRAFCPWCTAVHACSVVAAFMILVRAPFGGSAAAAEASQAPLSPLAALGGPLLGLLAFTTLLAGQLVGGYEIHVELVKTGGSAGDVAAASPAATPPAPRSMNAAAGTAMAPSPALPPSSVPPAEGRPAPRPVTLLDGKLGMTLGEYPILGDPNAEHILAMITDPTCPACRKMHGDLERAMEHFGGRFAVVLFPMALDQKCNPHLQRTGYGHRNACLFSLMSLAIWNTAPGAFRSFDTALFRGEIPPEAEDALGWGTELLGPQRLDEAMSNPVYSKMLDFSINLFYSPLVDQKLLPVLLGPKEAKLGNPETIEELYAWIGGQFGWNPPPAEPADLTPALIDSTGDDPTSNSLE